MFWSKGPGRIVRIGAWLLFLACLTFGTALIVLYAHPCPSSAQLQVPMSCGPRAIARIGNLNTLAGLGFLGLALLGGQAARSERRRERKARAQRESREGEPSVRVRLVANRDVRPRD